MIIFFIYMFSLLLTLNASPIRIMPLGDSITLGYPSEGGYRNYLWYQLEETRFDIDFVGSRDDGASVSPPFDSEHEGYGYWKMEDTANAVYGFLEANQADIILLHIGSNDVSPTQGVNSSSVEGLRKILNHIDDYERDYEHPIWVVLASIINRRSHHKTVTDFNKNLRTLANIRIGTGDKIILVDMETTAGIGSSDFTDATHPNHSGYSKMADEWFSGLSTLLPSLVPPNPLIEPFVKRFYLKILLREGEELGVSGWTISLAGLELTAANLARGFIFSDEFKSQDNNDSVFLEILYSAFFDRVGDSAGLDYWTEKLNLGESRFTVLNGFLHSIEFESLTLQYNILAVDPAEFFVLRFYTKVLEREAEKDGFIDWVGKLRTRMTSASGIARAFFFSDEFINKDTDNTTYITLLYRALLDREPDASGLEYWALKLEQGLKREEILNGFIKSPEFKQLAKIYNVQL